MTLEPGGDLSLENPDTVTENCGDPPTKTSSLKVVTLILAVGIGLRLIHCFGAVEMWYDELAVIRNVQDRGWVELVSRPLDHRQVAPVGFLLYQKLTCELFGYSDIGVRVGSTLVGIVGLFLFWRIAGRFTSGFALYAPLTLFAVSPAMVMYGGSPKPYIGDVVSGLLLFWMTLRYLERPDDVRRGLLAGIVGGAVMLMSFPVVPVGAILGLVLVVHWWRNRQTIRAAPLTCLGTCWLAGIGIAGLIAMNLLDSTTNEFMRDFWADDFPPLSPLSAAVVWSLTKIYTVFGHSLIYVSPFFPPLIPLVALPMLVAVVGLWFSGRERRWGPFLFLIPMVAGLAAAFLHLLPFEQRLGVYSGWPILVLTGIGLDKLRDSLSGKLRYTGRVLAVLMTMPLAILVLFAARPPYHHDFHAIAVLSKLADRIEPDDRIYVYTQGRHAIAFYGGRRGIEGWTQGERHYDEPRGYLTEVDVLRGEARVWFFWVRMRNDEPGLIRRYLETIGHPLEELSNDGNGSSGAVLYDLSDPEKLDQATAETFEIGDL